MESDQSDLRKFSIFSKYLSDAVINSVGIMIGLGSVCVTFLMEKFVGIPDFWSSTFSLPSAMNWGNQILG